MKKIITMTIMAITINVIAQVPTSGLVGYWPFTGNANDLSGNGNHGIVYNASLTTDRFGNSNSAYQFVGNDNNTVSYIVANYNNLPSGNTPRTISVWATNDSYGIPGGSGNDGHPLFGYGATMTNSANEIMFFTNSSSQPYVRYAGFNNDLDIMFTYNLAEWYNIVTTFDGTTAKLYVNNILLDSGIFSSWNTILDSLLIGSQTTRTRFHNGKIDDVRVYDRILDSLEISSLFSEENPNTVGVNSITYQNSIEIYPNPTNDILNIDLGSNFPTNNGFTLKITNSISQTVLTVPINSQTSEINFSDWAKGIYFVHLLDNSNNTFEIRKIVLQ